MVTTRLTRAEQVNRNRALVLDAARQVFLERGYAGATLEAIAETAGFSKGVMYSQFASKADLMLALIDARIEERAAENVRIAARSAGIEGLLRLMRANARRNADGGDWARLLIEFRVVAARDSKVNDRYAALHGRALDMFAEAVRTILVRGGLSSSYPPRVLAELIFALDSGRVLEQAAGTSQLDVDLVVDFIVRSATPL